MSWFEDLAHELRELRREIKFLLFILSHRRRYIGVVITQECVPMANPAQLVTGKPAQATATAVDTAGNPVTTTFTWSTDNAAVATIDPSSGAITVVDVGSVTVSATDPGGDVGTCACTVTAAGPGVLKITVDVTQS